MAMQRRGSGGGGGMRSTGGGGNSPQLESLAKVQARRVDMFRASLLDPLAPAWPAVPPPTQAFSVVTEGADGARPSAAVLGEIIRTDQGFAASEYAEIQSRLARLDAALARYDWDEIMSTVQREGAATGLASLAGDGEAHEAPTVFLTEVAPLAAEMQSGADSARGSDAASRAAEAERQRRVDAYAAQHNIVSVAVYPGFHPDEMTPLPLPDGMNAADCLLHITRHLSFVTLMPWSDWVSLFVSRPAVDVLMDSFWYFWCDEYMASKLQAMLRRKVLNAIFARVARNYYTLFELVPSRYKDDFFARYPNALAMALFYTFCKCFPQSVFTSFDEAFKAKLANMTFLWVTGSPPSGPVWASWPPRLLPEAKDLLAIVRDTTSRVVRDFNSMFYTQGPATQGSAAAPETGGSPVRGGGRGPQTPAASAPLAPPPIALRPSTNIEELAASRQAKFVQWRAERELAGRQAKQQRDPAVAPSSAVAPTRGQPAPPPVEGPPRSVFARVPFNLNGQSPLIAFHLRAQPPAPGVARHVLVQRTEDLGARGLPSFATAAAAVVAKVEPARLQYAASERSTRKLLAAAEADRQDHVQLIAAARKEVLSIPRKADRVLRIRKYVDELIVQLIPEVSLSWIEEVEGTDAAIGVAAGGPLGYRAAAQPAPPPLVSVASTIELPANAPALS